MNMTNIPELYGSMVFNDSVMRAKLPQEIYRLRWTLLVPELLPT